MTEEELARKSEIERVTEKRSTQSEAAIKLGLSQRQLRRILQRYRKEGVSGLVSKKRGVTVEIRKRLDGAGGQGQWVDSSHSTEDK